MGESIKIRLIPLLTKLKRVIFNLKTYLLLSTLKKGHSNHTNKAEITLGKALSFIINFCSYKMLIKFTKN